MHCARGMVVGRIAKGPSDCRSGGQSAHSYHQRSTITKQLSYLLKCLASLAADRIIRTGTNRSGERVNIYIPQYPRSSCRPARPCLLVAPCHQRMCAASMHDGSGGHTDHHDAPRTARRAPLPAAREGVGGVCVVWCSLRGF